MIKNKSFDISKSFALIALIVIFIFFCIFGNNFFKIETFVNILSSSYYIGFLAMGATFVILTGGIDLSSGTVMIASALIGGVAYTNWGWSIGSALVLCVVVGILFGFLNGFLVTKCKIVPFVATLGTQMIASGLGAMISNVTTMRYPAIGTEDAWFKYAFFRSKSGLPSGVIWLVFFFIIAYVLLNKTVIGRYTYAMGSNEEAAKLSGVNIVKWKMIVYLINGMFCGLAAIFYAAAYTTIIPSIGAGIEILGLAAVVIGGTSLSGGVGKLSGTMIGVFIMSILKQGLMSMNFQAHYQTFITGIVVVMAVMLDNYKNKDELR